MNKTIDLNIKEILVISGGVRTLQEVLEPFDQHYAPHHNAHGNQNVEFLIDMICLYTPKFVLFPLGIYIGYKVIVPTLDYLITNPKTALLCTGASLFSSLFFVI